MTTLPSRASGTRRMVLSGDSMTRWVHTVNRLPFSSVTDVRDCPLPLQVHPMPSLSHVMQRGHALEPRVFPLLVSTVAGEAHLMLWIPLPQSDFLQSWGPIVDFFFCPGSYRSYEGPHCGVMCAVGSPREQGLMWGLPQLSMNRCMLPPASFTFQQGGFLETKRSQAI